MYVAVRQTTLMMAFAPAAVLWMCQFIGTADAEIFLGSLSTRAHQVTGNVWLLSKTVIEIRGFTYDGTAPAAYFWADTNPMPSNGGQVLSDGSPSSGCAVEVGDPELPGLTSVTQRVEFPGDLTIDDFLGGSLSVWCEAFSSNFGSITLPNWITESELSTSGPALQCTGTSSAAGGGSTAVSDGGAAAPAIASTPQGYNCEALDDDYQVRWKVNGGSLDIELVGKIPDDSYMAFGVSGLPDRPFMIGADVVVADMPSAGGSARARDFFMDGRAQCNGVAGVCADTGSGFTDDVTSVSGEKGSGLTVVRYTRPLVPSDLSARSSVGQLVDQGISAAAGVETFLAWAIGPIDPTSGNPFFHSIGHIGVNGGFAIALEFGRSVVDNCQPLIAELANDAEVAAGPPTPFNRPFVGDDETVFNVHVGPSGGPRGYSAITDGLVSWGVAYWINGFLIPELVLRRGTKYTFRINGGNDPTDGANYHPVYLTTSPRGGYFQLSPEDRLNETPLAGIWITETDRWSGAVIDFEATALAPICLYQTTGASAGAELSSFEEYAATIDMSCAENYNNQWAETGIIEFTPDRWTPDVFYYQCVTHANLGFKIRVIDEDAPAVTASPTAAPGGGEQAAAAAAAIDANGFQEVALEGQIAEASLLFKFNPADVRAGGQDTISIILEAPALAWVGWAVSNDGFMVGSEAVIGLPETGEVLKYTLGAKVVSGVQPRSADQQTLIDASIRQEGGNTILSFTKILNEPGEIPILLDGDNIFLSSWGFADSLAVHAARGSFLLSGEALEVRKQSLWKAHGWLAAIAWGLLSPMAIASSVLRRFIPGGGTWFQIHRALNILVVTFTIAAFGIAVAAINQETPAGAESNHFDKNLSEGHRTIGLAIFILALLQAIGGILRPHLPHSGRSEPSDEEENKNMIPEAARPVNPKSSARVGWEIAHKAMGLGILALCWYQVQLGIKLYSNIFNLGDTGAMLPAFWAIAATLGAMILGGYILRIVLPS